MKTRTIPSLVLAGICSSTAMAVETFKTYDSFASAPIAGTRWLDGERSSSVKGGALVLSQRAYGSSASDVGTSYEILRERFEDAAAVTEVRAKITVTALEVNACAGNPAVSQSRARINGSFYNIGTPVAGSEVGDAVAQLRLTRFSNSTDPAGVLRVQGILLHCTSADCQASTTVQVVDLGTVSVGTATTVQMQWDKPNKQFLFSRDAGAQSGAIVYTDNDSQPPGVLFRGLDTRLDIANCSNPTALTGFVNATFDNVAVNKSAAP